MGIVQINAIAGNDGERTRPRVKPCIFSSLLISK